MSEEKGVSRPIPVRLSPENDLAVKRFLEQHKIHNRNLAINIMLGNCAKYEAERAEAVKVILKLMRYWGINLKELE